MKKFYPFLLMILFVFVVTTALLLLTRAETSEVLAGSEAVVHRDQNCGCCEIHERYLSNLGVEVSTEIRSHDEIMAIKAEYGVPYELSSCHTTIIDGYVVEGHMPHEAIELLLKEQPDILGIALPGMPSGSPGMPGLKAEPFVIYSLHEGGGVGIFQEL
jgi:hypothetical protein